MQNTCMHTFLSVCVNTYMALARWNYCVSCHMLYKSKTCRSIISLFSLNFLLTSSRQWYFCKGKWSGALVFIGMWGKSAPLFKSLTQIICPSNLISQDSHRNSLIFSTHDVEQAFQKDSIRVEKRISLSLWYMSLQSMSNHIYIEWLTILLD